MTFVVRVEVEAKNLGDAVDAVSAVVYMAESYGVTVHGVTGEETPTLGDRPKQE